MIQLHSPDDIDTLASKTLGTDATLALQTWVSDFIEPGTDAYRLRFQRSGCISYYPGEFAWQKREDFVRDLYDTIQTVPDWYIQTGTRLPEHLWERYPGYYEHLLEKVVGR